MVKSSTRLTSWIGCCARVQQRWIFAVMGSLAVLNAYTMRSCLSVAITEMVKTKVKTSNTTVPDDTCPSFETTNITSTSGGTYEWSEYTQGIILSSFYWGYIVTQIPGGLLVQKFGGKWTLGLGILSTGIFTLLTPIVVQLYDSMGLIALRVLMGLGEGTTYPAISTLISQWAPAHERTKIGNLVISGNMLGTVLGTALPGVLIQYSSIGWPLVFYFFGGVSIVWFLAFVVLCYDNPEVHPFISEEEKKYMSESMNQHITKHDGAAPWILILTSAPVWALVAGKSGFSWGYHTMMSDLPKYMSDVLKMSIQATSLLSALPYVLTWLVSNVASWLADWLIRNDKVSRTHMRKYYAVFSALVSATLIVGASYAGCDRTVIVILFTFGVGVMGFFFPSLLVNPNDLSPNYAGSLMALTNFFMAFTGVATPYVVGVLTPNHSPVEWRTVFWIAFGISCVSAAIFGIWGDGDVQHWNTPDLPDRKPSKSEHKEDSV